MSIVRACLRIAAVMAVREAGWPGTRVSDTSNAPLGEAVQKNPAPFVSVFTELDEMTIEGRDIYAGDRRLTLAFEFGLAGPVKQAKGGPAVAIHEADSPYERAVDLLESRIDAAFIGDPRGPWGEICRGLCTNIHETRSQRAGDTSKGVRWAARQKIFVVNTVADPVPGQMLDEGTAIMKFLALATDNPNADVAELATLIRAELAAAPDIVWRQVQAMLGLTIDEVRGIGVAPPDQVLGDDAEAPPLAQPDEISLPQEVMTPGLGQVEGIP
jgi:hypothetical protein